MRRLFLTTAIVLSFASTFAQSMYYTMSLHNDNHCYKEVGFTIWNQGSIDDTVIITLDWGDGNTELQNYSSNAFTYSYVTVAHSYSVAGHYTVSAHATTTQIGNTISDPNQTVYTFAPFGLNECGYAYILINNNNYDCNLNHPKLDFTDNQGNVTTITRSGATGYYTPIEANNTYFCGLNPSNAPYTVSFNAGWLASEGLTQTTPDITISDFAPEGYAILPNYLMDVELITNAGLLADPAFQYGSAWNFVAPLQSGNLNINLNNRTCQTMTGSATVSVKLPPFFIPNLSALLNASVVGNILTFDVAETMNNYIVSIPFTFPGNTPAGTDFCFDVWLTYANDLDTTNNSGQICGTVLNSYDPNNKQVNKAERLNPDVKEALVYRVQFQNDGNLEAYNVKITDIIDADLDLSTLVVLESSHTLITTSNPTTRQVDFKFNNIFLGASSVDLAASQGYVVYQIMENDNLAVGTEIENTASIYFDFNPAIVTNTTYNINEYALGIDKLDAATIQVYPNPAKENITFTGAEVSDVNIYDLSGKLVLSSDKISNGTVSVSSLNNGFYTVVANTTNGTTTTKLSIQR